MFFNYGLGQGSSIQKVLLLLDSPVKPGNDEFSFPLFFCGSYFYKVFLGHDTRLNIIN